MKRFSKASTTQRRLCNTFKSRNASNIKHKKHGWKLVSMSFASKSGSNRHQNYNFNVKIRSDNLFLDWSLVFYCSNKSFTKVSSFTRHCHTLTWLKQSFFSLHFPTLFLSISFSSTVCKAGSNLPFSTTIARIFMLLRCYLMSIFA